jgi:tetratricopeptide (TPR) repeat protein
MAVARAQCLAGDMMSCETFEDLGEGVVNPNSEPILNGIEMKLDRINELEEAKMAALSGDYENALRITESVLNHFPDDIDVLRLKGNIIELWISAEFDAISSMERDIQLKLARACYEKILTLDSKNILVLRDLADHLKDLGEKSGASVLYKKLISILYIDSASGRDVNNELREALGEYEDLLET